MTNEQLIRQYYDGDDAALEKLYHKNIGLIRGIAKETAAEFNCLIMEQHHPNQFSAYTKTILDDLCGEGALSFWHGFRVGSMTRAAPCSPPTSTRI